MDGVISDSMKAHGINYKKNHGVSITRIREIAGMFKKSHDLAQQLWLSESREMMILATLLQPEETFTSEMASAWLKKCTNIELIEQAALNLYQHLEFAPEFSLSCIKSEYIYPKIFGFILALRIYQRLSPQAVTTILEEIRNTSESDKDTLLFNSIANCLARLCRKNEATAALILEKVQDFASGHPTGKNHIYRTVKQELIFLGYIDDKF